MSRIPRSFRLEPIDEHARSGRPQIVFGHRANQDGHNEEFAIARFRDEAWQFPSGVPLGFEPEQYLP